MCLHEVVSFLLMSQAICHQEKFCMLRSSLSHKHNYNKLGIQMLFAPAQYILRNKPTGNIGNNLPYTVQK